MRAHATSLRRASVTIALQFTAFVFVLLLINGTVFLAIDLGNVSRQSSQRLQEMAHTIALQAGSGAEILLEVPSPPPRPPKDDENPHTEDDVPPPRRFPPMRDRIRIVDSGGTTVAGGSLFTQIPFAPREGVSSLILDDEDYTMVTEAIRTDGNITGYVQVIGLNRFQSEELPVRILLYLFVSVAISILTFFVGLLFARRSLRPAEQMMQRLSQFTQDASHELRTPLAVMQSSIDLALKSGKHREGLLSAKEDLVQASVLVKRLLELTRLDEFAITPVLLDLSVLTGEIVERHRMLAQEKRVTIRSMIEGKVMVEGDGALLRQLVGNLLSNAIKYSKPTGGEITVTLTREFLSVRDTGIGIPGGSLPRIFDRFYQADHSRSRGGFGLGLALVKRIAELHGWTLSVESTEGEGTVFTVKMG
ncbi:MAG: HAMP domain-containing sensor histidine kinase [Candidatus Peregrinibacteria bacterium]